ncbi:MAG: ABC transporter permease [Acholeplasmataceae bacterium]
MDKNSFRPISSERKGEKEQLRKSLTYWQDVWRRLRKNRLAIVGLISVVLVVLFAFIGPLLSPYSYDKQFRDYKNVPPRLEIYRLDDDLYVFVSGMLDLIHVSEDGHILGRFTDREDDLIDRTYTYHLYDDEGNDIATVTVDFSYQTDPTKADENLEYSLIYEGEEYKESHDTVWNRTFWFGTDLNGRDLLARVMYGARVSLIIAFFAAIINFFIGVVYGSISGFFGRNADLVMMRIVDIINSIPLLLYVILLMVVLKDSWFEVNVLDRIFGPGGLGTIILTLISVYWVVMARLVRGQILGLKEQEYVLAARSMGVSNRKIITKHLIPNTLGPIIVSLAMMIPAAVFTEAFLSFIGLGISAPRASLGSLASDGAQFMQTYPYQLLIPSLIIAFMMLAFNFLGDGLRDALDPRLRKG